MRRYLAGPRGKPAAVHSSAAIQRQQSFHVCVLKRKKAESEAQRGKPKGTLESESRNAIVQ